MLKRSKSTPAYLSTVWILMMIYPFFSFAAESVAPEITSGPSVFVKTDTAVIINWETDENSDSTIQYDHESRSWGEFAYAENDPELVTKHSLKLTGLVPDTKYFYRVGSVDAVGNGPDLNANNTNPSDEKSFRTLAVPDTTAPEIFDIRIVDFTADTTTFAFTTDEPGTTLLRYGISSSAWNSYDSRIRDDELVINHSFTMQTEWGTVYYFRIASTDYSGNGPSTSDTDENPTYEQRLTSRGDAPPDDGNTSNSGDTNPDEPAEPTCFIHALFQYRPLLPQGN